MSKNNSTLIQGLNAALFAAILFFVGAVVSFASGFVGWLGLIMLVLSCVLFFIEGNSFVRRASLNLIILYLLTIVSWLLFRVLLPWGFFRALNWIIDIAVTLFLVFSGLCALNGKRVDIPYLASFVDDLCN